MRTQWTISMRWRRAALAALAGMGMVPLGACGGGGPSGPSGPTRTVIGTQNGTRAAQTAGAHPVSANASGTLDASLDWGSSANDFDLFVTSNSCTTASLADLEGGVGACSHIASARSTTAKPERVTWSGSANVTYRVWVANFGPATDSYTLTAGITR